MSKTEKKVVGSKRMSAVELDKFLSKPREVFLRNPSETCQVSMSFGRAADYLGRWSSRMSVLIPPNSGWLRVVAPFEEIKNSEDFLSFATRGILEIWNPEDPNVWPSDYQHLTSLGKNRVTEVAKAEMSPPPIEADPLPEEKDEEELSEEGTPVSEPSEEQLREAVVQEACRARLEDAAGKPLSWLQFNDVLCAVEEENAAVQQQIEFHKRQIDFHSNSLLAVKRQFDEINPVYGVLLWLKENIFGDEPQKQLVRAALGEGPETGDENLDAKRRLTRFPSTYRTLLRRVRALSVDGKYANFRERAAAYNANSQSTPARGSILSDAEREAAQRIDEALRKGPKKTKKTIPRKAVPKSSKELTCDMCKYISKTPQGLGAHKFHVHGVKGSAPRTLRKKKGVK